MIFCVVLSRSAGSRDCFSIANLCTMFASGWQVSSSSVSTAPMSFNLARYSVTVHSSSFAASLFLGDFGNLVLLCDRSTLRHQVHGFGDPCLRLHVSVACSAAMCSCVRSSHPRPPVATAPVYRECPAGTHWDGDSFRQDDEPSERQLCAVLVLSCW